MEALKQFCSQLLSEMEQELFEIRLDHPKPEAWGKLSIALAKSCLDKLKDYIIKNPFKRRSEEIYFFKEVKPMVMGRLIYVTGVHNTEAKRPAPTESNAEQLDFLADQQDEIQSFFNINSDLYEYYKRQDDFMDSKLFVRDVQDRTTFREFPLIIDPVVFYGDPVFSTGFDYLLAQFHAYEWLRDHLENELEALLTVGDELPVPELKFTGTPGDFVEIVRMIKERVKPSDPKTGRLLSEEQIAIILRDKLSADWGTAEDYKTLEIITGGSDFPEQMEEILARLRKQWEEEEGDKEYGTDQDDPDQPKP